MWFKGFHSFTAQNVIILCFGGSQVIDVKVTVFVQHFCVGEGDLITAFALGFNDDPAYEVLTEVDDLFAPGCFENAEGFKGLVFFDRLIVGGYEYCFGKVGFDCGEPVLVVVAGFVPASLFLAGIDGFSMIYF